MNDIGRQHRGQKHYPIRTEDQAREEIERGAEYSKKENAISLDIYLAGRGVRDEVRVAMMKAHVPAGVTIAPKGDWDRFFENF